MTDPEETTMSNDLSHRDADDAHADDGPPTDAATDEVKADSAADGFAETAADEDAAG